MLVMFGVEWILVCYLGKWAADLDCCVLPAGFGALAGIAGFAPVRFAQFTAGAFGAAAAGGIAVEKAAAGRIVG